jgi:hypothetical protein
LPDVYFLFAIAIEVDAGYWYGGAGLFKLSIIGKDGWRTRPYSNLGEFTENKPT